MITCILFMLFLGPFLVPGETLLNIKKKTLTPINTTEGAVVKNNIIDIQGQCKDCFWDTTDKDLCNFRFHNQFIHFQNCFDMAEIFSDHGKVRIPCSQIAYVSFFGIIAIKSGNCSQIVKTNSYCTNYPYDGSSIEIPCRDKMRNDTILLLTSCIILSTIVIFVMRFLRVISHHHCKIGIASEKTYKDKVIVFKVVTKKEEPVKLKSGIEEIKLPTILNSVVYESYDWKAILLLMLFVHSPNSTRNFPMDQEVIEIDLYKGDSVTIGEFHFKMNWYKTYFPLIYQYTTGSWEYRAKWMRDCAGNRCGGIGDCYRHGSFGEPYNSTHLIPGKEPGFSRLEIGNCEWGSHFAGSAVDAIQSK